MSRAPSLSLISCISLEFCSGAGQSPKPVQPNPFTSLVTTQGQQGFPHGVPGRVGVPTWHGHTLLSLVTGQRSHSSGPGGPLRPCLPPQGVTHQQWYLFNDFLIEPVDKVRTPR